MTCRQLGAPNPDQVQMIWPGGLALATPDVIIPAGYTVRLYRPDDELGFMP